MTTADKERQSKQILAVRDYVRAHPGVSHALAFAAVQSERADLFPPEARVESMAAEAEGQRTLAEHKMRMVKAEITAERALDPKLSFVAAWNRKRKERPELFEHPKEGSAAAVRMQPAHSARANLQTKRPAVVKATCGKVVTVQGGFFIPVHGGPVVAVRGG